MQIKTVVLPDGTYGTQIKQAEVEHISKLREYLMNNSFISSSLTRTLMKLLLKIDNSEFNKFGS